MFGGVSTSLILTRFHNRSCLRIYMSDHFLDGWDRAVLTIRSPDNTNDTFHPHCDQVNPFYVRYCPYQPEDTGTYVAKVFAATNSRFFWEISWKVLVEYTGQWYRGDFASKMVFKFDSETLGFRFYSGENLIDMNAPCYKCTTVDTQSWTQLQSSGAASFLKLVVTGFSFFSSCFVIGHLV